MVKNLVVIASSKSISSSSSSDDPDDNLEEPVVLSEDGFYSDCKDANIDFLSFGRQYTTTPGEETIESLIKLGLYWTLAYKRHDILKNLCYDNDLLQKYKDLITHSRKDFASLLDAVWSQQGKITEIPFYLEVLKEEYENLLKRNSNSCHDFLSDLDGIYSKMISNSLDFIDAKRMINIYFIILSTTQSWAPSFQILELLLDIVGSEYTKAVFNKYVFVSSSHYSPSIRGSLYTLYISRGLLERKTARKIRSEQSSAASEKGVEAFLYSYEKYKNAEELLALFQDSKHVDVQRLITRKAPANTLWRFVSFSDYMCVQYLKERMGQ